MNLVFGASGLTVGEGAFLMACCNHTDARGYVIASMRQIRDEAHLGESAAKSNKKRLLDRGLLASSERYHPKNGARVADLYRVNVSALKTMQRTNTDYGPTVVEELTFGASQENPSSPPPPEFDGGGPSDSGGGGSDSGGGGSDSGGDAGSESDPHFPPSSTPSPVSGATAANENEREDGPAVPRQQGEQKVDGVGLVLAGWAIGAGLKTPPASVRKQLAAQVTELAAEYPTADELHTVAEFAGGRRWTDLGRAAIHPECGKRLALVRPGQSADRRERCPEHPRHLRAGCMDCAMAVPA